MRNEETWAAIYVRPGLTKKVCRSLERNDIEFFYPAFPFFPALVFIKGNCDKLSQAAAIPNVANFVYWLDKPAIFDNDGIESLQAFLGAHEITGFDKIDVHEAETTREFKVILRTKEYLHTIVLPAMGYRLSATVKTSTSVQVLRKSNRKFGGLAFLLGFQK